MGTPSNQAQGPSGNGLDTGPHKPVDPIVNDPATPSRSDYWGHLESGIRFETLLDDDVDIEPFAADVREHAVGPTDAPAGSSPPDSPSSPPTEQSPETKDSSTTTAEGSPAFGKPFGSYLLQTELGRGGMGVVYMAYHRELRRHCALKMLHSDAQDMEAKERFVREAHSSAKIGKHPNIVQVFDAGIVDGKPYIAMEFVVGQPLDRRLKQEGALSTAESLELGYKIALALDHAHRR
ncbi:serine/threonine protein kinase, partial [Planctomycetota bacterium]